ncbi:interleukin-22 receptor subunit alpha-2 [Lampris incognitus]|uniref:interleukin-22 receptor subunit alpha-2 n=1 Tax=Lampris incognitus TaxID=2546036 RepID=UPI0024B52A3D|nr:interleukin-22 receptor subunit alpha-2 [Lampris incognitus]
MTSQLLGATLLGNLLVCFAAQVSAFLVPPAMVKFDSVDYKNVLRWTPSSNDTSLQYYVQWKIYGEAQWQDVEGCQGIGTTYCDLSVETSDAREWYYSRVHASSLLAASKSAWAMSRRFSPRSETKISPPRLRPHVVEKGIVVDVKPPHSLKKMQKKLWYKIYLIHATGEEDLFEICSQQLVINKLSSGTEYCLQVQTLIPLQGKTSVRSSLRCATPL